MSHPVSPGNPAVAQVVISTASALTTAVMFYLARTLRKFMKEHEWLMETTKSNTEAIRKMLEPEPPIRRRQPRRQQ